MRNEDKARAHLQSAMKYLGFGMNSPDKNSHDAAHGWDMDSSLYDNKDTKVWPAKGYKTQKEKDAERHELKEAQKRIREQENRRLSLHNTMKKKYNGRSAGGSYEV